MIKILLADDSIVVRTILREIFLRADDFAVIGEAANGREAVDKTRLLKPDLVVMDIIMPVMDGLSAIEEIMATCPVPILVLTATLDDREVNTAFTAIRKGALDVMGKPGGSDFTQTSEFTEKIIDRVRMLSRIKVIHHNMQRFSSDFSRVPVVQPTIARKILALGASTGGPRAVMGILRSLPADFGGTVFVVQHIAAGFAPGFAKWLGSESKIKVRVAENGDQFCGGEAIVAPNECHMVIKKGKIQLIDSPPVNSCRPSIDMLFSSLAEDQGARVMGILLTGMGKDGALGLLRIREQGGITIVQDEETSVVFGMPKAAISLDAAEQVLPLSEIPGAIMMSFAAEKVIQLRT